MSSATRSQLSYLSSLYDKLAIPPTKRMKPSNSRHADFLIKEMQDEIDLMRFGAQNEGE